MFNFVNSHQTILFDYLLNGPDIYVTQLVCYMFTIK